MRRNIPSPEPAGRTAPSRSVGEMRLDQADLARDAKKEEAMCASALCQNSSNLKEAPSLKRRDKGSDSEQQPRPQWTGRYGGRHLCQKHYEQVVDYIRDNGCLPSSDAGTASQQGGGPKSMEDFFDA